MLERAPLLQPAQTETIPDWRAFWRMQVRELEESEGSSNDHEREFAQLSGELRGVGAARFAELLERRRRLDELYSRMARRRAAQLLAHLPACLSSSDDQHRAWSVVIDLAFAYPAASETELLLILAADAFPAPAGCGRPTVWGGMVGRELVELVDEGLSIAGVSRDSRKALRRVIGAIRDALPEEFGQWSEEELRQGYYLALRAQSKNPSI